MLKRRLSIILVSFIATFLLVILTIGVFEFNQKRQLAQSFKELIERDILLADIPEIKAKLNSLKSFYNRVEIKFEYESITEEFRTSHFELKVKRDIIVNGSTTKSATIILSYTPLSDIGPIFLLTLFIGSFIATVAVYFIEVSSEKEKIERNKIFIREKEDIYRKVAHDIRSPLAALTNLLNAKSQIEPNEQRLISKSLNRIENITLDLLVQSRELKVNEFNLNETIKDVIQELKLKHSDFKIVFTPQLNAYIEADKSKVRRALANFLQNAYEAAPKKEITLLLEKNDTSLQLHISDRGHGMSEQELKNLLEGKLGTTKDNGNGLGFISSKESLESQGLTLKVESVKGLGTKVCIIIPAYREASLSIPTTTDKTIILFDDDDLIFELWNMQARKQGKTIIYSTGDINENILSLPRSTPIYTDLNLGKFNGLDIAKQLNDLGFKNIHIQSGEVLNIEELPSYICSTKNKEYPNE